MTAYFGLLDIGRPKAGETVVVYGAAGAVGQSSDRSRGSRDAAGRHRRRAKENATGSSRSGFDAAIDYKSEDVKGSGRIARKAWISISTTSAANPRRRCFRLTIGARIVICGAIAQYNKTTRRGPVQLSGPIG